MSALKPRTTEVVECKEQGNVFAEMLENKIFDEFLIKDKNQVPNGSILFTLPSVNRTKVMQALRHGKLTLYPPSLPRRYPATRLPGRIGNTIPKRQDVWGGNRA